MEANIKKQLETETKAYAELGKQYNALATEAQRIQEQMVAISAELTRKQGSIETLQRLLNNDEPPKPPTKKPPSRKPSAKTTGADKKSGT